MRSIPASLQTIYADLLQGHLGQPAFDFAGAPFTIERHGKLYWYANQRSVGASPVRQRYLGPDTEAMRSRIDAMRHQRANQEAFKELSARLIAQIRAGGIAGIDRQTGTALRALVRSGVFRLGGTLVGTQAFRHYDFELGVMLAETDGVDKTLRETQDLDIAAFEKLASTVEDEANPDLTQTLLELGYKPVSRLERNKPTSWRHANSTYDIDFLTPSFDDRQGPTLLKSLNVWAQGLHYLNFLIKDPMPAVSIYMEGLLVQVPQPQRYAIHKLIISQQRPPGSGAKARKDIQQARAIIWAMAEERSFDIKSAIEEANSMGEKWRSSLDRALDLKIEPQEPTQPGDSMEFVGKALGAAVRLRISGTALAMIAGSDLPPQQIAKSHQAHIERLFRSYFRAQPSPDVLLTSYNLPSLS